MNPTGPSILPIHAMELRPFVKASGTGFFAWLSPDAGQTSDIFAWARCPLEALRRAYASASSRRQIALITQANPP